MSTHVVILISNRCEGHLTKLAWVWFFARMSSHVYGEIAALIKFLFAKNARKKVEMSASLRIFKKTTLFILEFLSWIFLVGLQRSYLLFFRLLFTCTFLTDTIFSGSLMFKFLERAFADLQPVERYVARNQIELFLTWHLNLVKAN